MGLCKASNFSGLIFNDVGYHVLTSTVSISSSWFWGSNEKVWKLMLHLYYNGTLSLLI